MKKNRLIRLLALMPCVATLAGCGVKDDPKFIIKNLPESFHLGEVIDLDKYITVEGSSQSFKVYLYKESQNLASLDGHKITVKEEGKIKFSVYIGEVEEIISVTSITEMREALIKTFAKFDGEYVAYGANTDDQFFHYEEFAERVRYDHKNNAYLSNGYISPAKSDAGYEFSSDKDGHYYANPKLISKDSFEKLNHFSADIKGATRGSITLSVGETEVYTLTSSAMKNFTSSVMLTNASSYTLSVQVGEDEGTPVYEDVKTSISRVDFTLLGSGSDKVPYALIYGKLNGSTQLIDALWFSNDPVDFNEDSDIEEYVKNPSKLIFEDSPVNLLKELFEEYIPSERSLIAEYKYGWFDKTGERIEEPSDAKNTYFEGLPVGSSARVLSNNAIVTVVDERIASGVIQHEEGGVNTVYDVYLHNVSGEYQHSIEANPDYEEVYEDKYNSLAFIADERSLAFDSFYASKVENIGTETEPIDQYTLAPNLKRGYDFADGIFSCEDGISALASFFFQNQTKEFQKYFTYKLTFAPTLASVHFEFSLTWDRQGDQIYKVVFDLKHNSEHLYESTISDLFTEVFGS